MLSIGPGELERMRAHCESGYPHEVCGVLIGEEHAGLTLVREVLPGRNVNVDRPHTRYDLDPRSLLEAELRARALGCDVIGIYHSHPDRPAAASPTDRERAWPGLHYLIFAIAHGAVVDWRSFLLEQDEMVAEPVEARVRESVS